MMLLCIYYKKSIVKIVLWKAQQSASWSNAIKMAFGVIALILI